MTKEDRLRKQRERRRANGNADTKKYEKTPKGFLMRAYRNMQSRVEGIQRPGGSWEGKALLPREEFYAWALGSSQFWRLFKAWTAAEYDQRLTPSVNRIDPRRGYTLDNMEWITHSLNSGLSNTAPSRETMSNAAREAILG
jgi:hypothetical protein